MKKISFIVLIFNLLLVISCKKENTTQLNSQTDTEVSASIENQTSYSVEYLLKDVSGKELGGFSLEPLKIQHDKKTFTAKEKEGKRKYFTNGVLSYEVKYTSEGFKLKNSDSKLLWKVKTYPDKIKISDNEENLNPYEIRNKNGVFEISKDDKVIRTVNNLDKYIQVDKENKYEISTPIDSFAVAILGIDEIPWEQRLFILMEYLHQTK